MRGSKSSKRVGSGVIDKIDLITPCIRLRINTTSSDRNREIVNSRVKSRIA